MAIQNISPPTGGVGYYVRGLAGGTMIMAVLGAVWALATAGALSVSPLAAGLSYSAVLVIAALLVAAAVGLLRRARAIPHDTSPEAIARGRAIGRRMGIRFGVIFGLESLLIALASTLLSVTNHDDYIVPACVFIIGLHFLPLARLFQVPVYYATGILFSLVALAILLATSAVSYINHVSLWVALPASGTALVLWLTAAAVLLQGQRLLRQQLPYA